MQKIICIQIVIFLNVRYFRHITAAETVASLVHSALNEQILSLLDCNLDSLSF